MDKRTSKASGKSKKSGVKAEKYKTLPCGGRLRKEIVTKSLYLCSIEQYLLEPGLCSERHVIHAIDIFGLLTLSSPSQCLKLARLDVDDPPSGACGVSGGSKIIFAGDAYPGSIDPEKPLLETYAFSIHESNREIYMLSGKLKAGKTHPIMVEVAGELYILGLQNLNSFEVYDSVSDTWSELPRYPLVTARLHDFSYAVAGDKLFVSTFATFCGVESKKHSLFCFDPKKEKPEWRMVDTIGRRFPFEGEALVLNLPDPNKKLLLTLSFQQGIFLHKLVVYLMSLDENQESLVEICVMDLPVPFPDSQLLGLRLLSLGGNNVCFVIPCFWDAEEHQCVDYPKTYNMRGAAVPFRFRFDISKLGQKDCFTVQFEPPCIFDYHTSSDCSAPIFPFGCFLL